MSRKRPTCYKDWRALLHAEAASYGFACFTHRNSTALAHDHPLYVRFAKELERQYRRLQRIHKRLDAEWEAMDRSCAEALLEAVFPRKETT